MRWSEGGSQEDAALVAQLLAKALTGDDDGDECGPVRGDMCSRGHGPAGHAVSCSCYPLGGFDIHQVRWVSHTYHTSYNQTVNAASHLTCHQVSACHEGGLNSVLPALLTTGRPPAMQCARPGQSESLWRQPYSG